MRNLNNWVKGQLIEQSFDLTSSSSRGRRGISVLDFCCGKGGDVLKWLKSPKGSKIVFYSLVIYINSMLFSNPLLTPSLFSQLFLHIFSPLSPPPLFFFSSFLLSPLPSLSDLTRYVGVDIAVDSLKHFVDERLLMDSISEGQRLKVTQLVGADMGKDCLSSSCLETHTWRGGGTKNSSHWDNRSAR